MLLNQTFWIYCSFFLKSFVLFAKCEIQIFFRFCIECGCLPNRIVATTTAAAAATDNNNIKNTRQNYDQRKKRRRRVFCVLYVLQHQRFKRIKKQHTIVKNGYGFYLDQRTVRCGGTYSYRYTYYILCVFIFFFSFYLCCFFRCVLYLDFFGSFVHLNNFSFGICITSSLAVIGCETNKRVRTAKWENNGRYVFVCLYFRFVYVCIYSCSGSPLICFVLRCVVCDAFIFLISWIHCIELRSRANRLQNRF